MKKQLFGKNYGRWNPSCMLRRLSLPLIAGLFALPSSHAQTQVGPVINGQNSMSKFGHSVSINRSGYRVAVGSKDYHVYDRGAIHCYEYDPCTDQWNPMGGILNGKNTFDFFGTSVSMGQDGQFVAGGAPQPNSSRPGYLALLEWVEPINGDPDHWAAVLLPLEGYNSGDEFGHSVSMGKYQGIQRIAVGAPKFNGATTDEGMVKVTEVRVVNGNLAWVDIGNDIVGTQEREEFGSAVSLSMDGNWLAIGAPKFDCPTCPVTDNRGRVRVYEWDNANNEWDFVNELTGFRPGSEFGTSVAISDDGSRVIVGGPMDNNGSFTDNGYAEVYETTSGMQIGSSFEGLATDDKLGTSVSISEDGSIITIGSIEDRMNTTDDKGVVRAYQYNASTMDWDQMPSPSIEYEGTEIFGHFGQSVELTADGSRFIAGGPLQDLGHAIVNELFDGHPLDIASSVPADDATNVSPSLSELVINFNEPFLRGIGNITLFNDRTGESFTFDIYDNRITLIGTTSLELDLTGIQIDCATPYHVILDCDAIRSGDLTPYEGLTDPTQWNFYTGTDLQQVLTQTTPADDDINVSSNLSSLDMMFNIPVQPGLTGNIYLKSENGITTEIPVDGPWVDISGNLVSVDLSNIQLVCGMRYHVLIDHCAFADLAGNSISGIDDPTAWNFITGRELEPIITSTSPADGATGLTSSLTTLTINLSEGGFPGSGFINLVDPLGNQTSFDVTGPLVNFQKRVINIDVSNVNFSCGNYHVLIDNCAIEDGSGNGFTAISDPTYWDFTFGTDLAPVVTTLAPTNGNTDVEIDLNHLELTFNQNIQAGLGFISLVNENGGVTTFDVTTNQVSFNGNTVSIDLTNIAQGPFNVSNTLACNTAYHVLVDCGAMLDQSGNVLGGIDDPTFWSFTTNGNFTERGDIAGDAIYDYLGAATAISEDGTIIAVAATEAGDNFCSNAGAGYVRTYKLQYDFSNDSWSWTQFGNDLNGISVGDGFGASIAISADGQRVAVGAPQNSFCGSGGSGYVQIYSYNSNNNEWDPAGSLSGAVNGDWFGYSLDLSDDGNTLAVGAPFRNNNAGEVQVFEYQSGTTWQLVGSAIDGEDFEDASGWSVALSSNGQRVAIGGKGNPFSSPAQAGQARVFEYNVCPGSGFPNFTYCWNQLGSTIESTIGNDKFATSIALSGTGNRLVVGAEGGGSQGEGLVRVYDLSGSWNQAGGDLTGTSTADKFGTSVSVSEDGSRVSVGASSTSEVTIHEWDASSQVWNTLCSTIESPVSFDNFGASHAITDQGSMVVIGAPADDETASNSGKVYVYQLSVPNSYRKFVEAPESELPSVQVNNSNMLIYPNPHQGFGSATLELNLAADAPVQVQAYDISGRLITNLFNGNLTGGKQTIPLNVSNWESGIYLITVNTNGQLETTKFVKR